MRFSLKLFLIVLALVCVGIGGYVRHREAELGVKFQVANPIELEEFYDAPKFILEIKSRRQVRDHNLHLEISETEGLIERLADLRKNIAVVDVQSDVDVDLIEQHRDEFVELAKSKLEDPDFMIAMAAAGILEKCGDQTAFPIYRDRVIAAFDSNEGFSYRFIDSFMITFGRERLAKDDSFVELMQSIAGGEGRLAETANSFLYFEGIDESHYRQKMRKQSRQGRDKAYALMFLLEHHFDPETVQVLEEYLDTEKRGFSYSRLRHLLQIHNDDPAWPQLRGRIEVASHRFMRKPGAGFWVEDQTKHWEVVSKFGTLASADFFRNAMENTKDQKQYNHRALRILYACRGLIRLGLQQDAEELMLKILKANQAYEISVYPDTKVELLDVAETLWGRERIVEICKQHIDHRRCQGACRKLSSLYANTGDEAISQLIVDASEGYHRDDSIAYVERIGSPLAFELWKNAESRSNSLSLHETWKARGINRQDLVDWINTTLEPPNELSVKTVLKSPRYPGSDHQGAIQKPVVDTDYQFTVLALAHSGFGNLFSEFYRPSRDELESVLVDLAATESSDFRIKSAQLNWPDGSYDYSLVVNGRLYKFSIDPGRDIIEESGSRYYDNYYPIESSLEILNAIAARQRLKGRFFYYPGEGIGVSVNVVVYLEPHIATELQTEFGIKPMTGFEYYLR